MAEDRIKRKDLWQSMENITPSNWCRACQRLGLAVSLSGGKGSHARVRDPKNPDPADAKGHITTIPYHVYRQINHKIFKQLLVFGMAEDDIWKALKML